MKEFQTIEEASANTGISIPSIKIRCNKPGCGGKDHTLFEWTDDYTKRYFRAKKSKARGSGLEYEIVENLKRIGYENVCRSAGESKKLDSAKVDIADPSGELEVAIQAKNQQLFPNYFDIKDSCSDSRDFVLIWKKSPKGDEASSRGTVAIVDSAFFYKLLETYHKNK